MHNGTRYRFDLIELADLAEVEDVPSAASDLARAKRKDSEDPKARRGNWQHTLATLHQEQADRRKRAAAEQALTEAGVKLLPRYRQTDATERPLSDLTTGLDKEITAEAHAAQCPGHAARLDKEHRPVYFCTDPEKNRHKIKGATDGEEAREAERAERRKVIESNKATRAAREVRKDFVTELVSHKAMSEAGWQLVSSTVLNNPDLYRRFMNKTGKGATADVARFTRAADPESKTEPFADLIQRTGKARRPQLLLAHIAAAHEAEMHDNMTSFIPGARLQFPLAQVLAAAEHAAAATEHKLLHAETVPRPCLWWVKDDGTYLMSNAVIGEDTPAKIRARTIVYADGWGTGTDARSLLGGDDFAEPFDLCDPTRTSDGTLLVLWL
ncbi:DUF3085 domain-containing protein [Actinacidiphila soli]|uniref:DUF3085 domain-containing protein n=1 Tax=Actinacidiphila soli TaxID=2487275 RepID=UPI000FCC13F4|nr:DUF3085 domain-containing protein [Actinacidiphila soli]